MCGRYEAAAAAAKTVGRSVLSTERWKDGMGCPGNVFVDKILEKKTIKRDLWESEELVANPLPVAVVVVAL